jgi:hypothetical protein
MIALARHYADLIDDATDRLFEAEEEDQARDFARMVAIVAKIGPRLEATLDRLGMSPGARPAVRNGGDAGGDPASAALERVRSDTAAASDGVDYAAAVDPSVAAADVAD